MTKIDGNGTREGAKSPATTTSTAGGGGGGLSRGLSKGRLSVRFETPVQQQQQVNSGNGTGSNSIATSNVSNSNSNNAGGAGRPVTVNGSGPEMDAALLRAMGQRYVSSTLCCLSSNMHVRRRVIPLIRALETQSQDNHDDPFRFRRHIIHVLCFTPPRSHQHRAKPFLLLIIIFREPKRLSCRRKHISLCTLCANLIAHV
jgi:hypothetical protein